MRTAGPNGDTAPAIRGSLEPGQIKHPHGDSLGPDPVGPAAGAPGRGKRGHSLIA